MGQLAAKMIMPSARVRNRCRIAALAVATLSLCLSNTYASTGAVDLTRGLLGRWTFDEGKGAIAGDVSGRDNHGKIMGGAKWAKGKIGGALEFDGSDDFVSIPNEGAFDITDGVTVSAWIRVESFTKPWQAFVTK